VLIGGIVVAAVLAAFAAGIVTRRRSHDDVHSVEHYHRQLHTLEGMNAHPAGSGRENGAGGGGPAAEAASARPAFPASALRLAGSATVRLTEPAKPVVPPVPPPQVAKGGEPVHFDDAADLPPPPSPSPEAAVTSTLPPGPGPIWRQDRTMEAINHRPRRLGAPAGAVAAVIVIVAVLLVTGSHSVTPPHHAKSTAAGHALPPVKTHHVTPTTTAPLLVSAPASASPHGATYTVGLSNFSLVLSATTAECWVDATETGNGSTLFTGVLFPGEAHTVTASGAVTVIAGAPGAFTATVNGTSVTLPDGYQAPFTLSFVPAATAA
jgi:hypothetical protein